MKERFDYLFFKRYEGKFSKKTLDEIDELLKEADKNKDIPTLEEISAELTYRQAELDADGNLSKLYNNNIYYPENVYEAFDEFIDNFIDSLSYEKLKKYFGDNYNEDGEFVYDSGELANSIWDLYDVSDIINDILDEEDKKIFFDDYANWLADKDGVIDYLREREED